MEGNVASVCGESEKNIRISYVYLLYIREDKERQRKRKKKEEIKKERKRKKVHNKRYIAFLILSKRCIRWGRLVLTSEENV